MIESKYIVGALLAPIFLLHTFARGYVLLRPPLSTAFKWTAPLVVCAAIVLPLIDITLIRASAALLIVHLQWIIVRHLYQRFIDRNGRTPRDVYFKPNLPNSGPDRNLFIFGSIALAIAPLLLIGLSVEIAKRMA